MCKNIKLDIIMENNTKQITLSIEQMDHLEDLGCDTSSASMYWVYFPTCNAIINNTNEFEKEPTLMLNTPEMDVTYPAFSLQDLLKLLPTKIERASGKSFDLTITKSSSSWTVYYNNKVTYSDPSLLTATYKVICILLKTCQIK